MNKIKLIILSIVALTLATSSTIAQETEVQNSPLIIAYINSNELLDGLKEKEEASNKLLNLSDNYKKELELMQKDYNKKYSDYLTYQNTFADNIKLRRMQELTELENRIREFTKLAQEDIEQQEQLLLQPLKDKIKEAIRQVGIENNYTIIYDLADSNIAFLNPSAIDANSQVKRKLNR